MATLEDRIASVIRKAHRFGGKTYQEIAADVVEMFERVEVYVDIDTDLSAPVFYSPTPELLNLRVTNRDDGSIEPMIVHDPHEVEFMDEANIQDRINQATDIADTSSHDDAGVCESLKQREEE